MSWRKLLPATRGDILLLRMFIVNQSEQINMATKEAFAQALRDAKVQLDKAKQEILDKVSKLEGEIATAGASSPEMDAALADLKGAAQGLDDLNVDTPTEQPAEAPAPAPAPDTPEQ